MNGTGTASRTFPATPEALPEARGFLRDRARDADLTDALTDDLILAVSEACANAVLHSGSPEFDVEWREDRDVVEVLVRDHGAFKRRVRVASLEGPGGFGIPLMTALTDQLEIREGTSSEPGTRVRLIKRRP